MRIAIDGAQSTGKTTLFHALHASFQCDFTFIPEGARVIGPQMGIASPEDWLPVLSKQELLVEFFTRLRDWQIAQEAASTAFIVDCSFILHRAYRDYFGASEVRFPESQYDLILFCPTGGVPFSQDGFRFERGREQVETRYLELVENRSYGTLVKLPSGIERVITAEREIARHCEHRFR
jgi:nicotinamide riboside kinase